MPFRTSLQALVKNADDDVSQFRTSVEKWYDDHMDRVSGWYKRHAAQITLVAGAIIVVMLNLNALTIGRTLYTENAVSAAVSTVAAKTTSCSSVSAGLPDQPRGPAIGRGRGRPAGRLGNRPGLAPSTARSAAGWTSAGSSARHGGSGWQLVLVLIGFLIMIISLLPGAQFWFGLLTKLGTLRQAADRPQAIPSATDRLTSANAYFDALRTGRRRQ